MRQKELLELAMRGALEYRMELLAQIAMISQHMAGEEGFGHLAEFRTSPQNQEKRREAVAAGMTPLQAWRKYAQ